VTKVEALMAWACEEKASKSRASEAAQEAVTPFVHLDESVLEAQSYSSAQLPPGYRRSDMPADLRSPLIVGASDPVYTLSQAATFTPKAIDPTTYPVGVERTPFDDTAVPQPARIRAVTAT
jgi:hypothetical protein